MKTLTLLRSLVLLLAMTALSPAWANSVSVRIQLVDNREMVSEMAQSVSLAAPLQAEWESLLQQARQGGEAAALQGLRRWEMQVLRSAQSVSEREALSGLVMARRQIWNAEIR